MSRIDVDSVPDTTNARQSLPDATVYQDDFVETGLELSVTGTTLTVPPGACHYTHSGTYYRADLGASPGISVPSSAVTSVYVDFANESIVADGTTPSEPFLKIGEVDTTTDPSTTSESNRTPVTKGASVDGTDISPSSVDTERGYIDHVPMGTRRRVRDQRIPVNSTWDKSSNNPVLTPGSPTWRSDFVADCTPFVVPEHETMYVIAEGHDGSQASIGIAESTDGESFSWRDDINPIFDPSGSSSWPWLAREGDTIYHHHRNTSAGEKLYKIDVSDFPAADADWTEISGWSDTANSGRFGSSSPEGEYGFIKYRGYWWIIHSNNDFIKLYYGEDIEDQSSFRPHAGNPFPHPGDNGGSVYLNAITTASGHGDNGIICYAENNENNDGNTMLELMFSGLSPTTATMVNNGVAIPLSGSGFDDTRIHAANICYFNGKWRMVYDGETGSRDWQIGLATQGDGL